MGMAKEFWVYVQQPTVPHYRLPFFDAVDKRLQHRLCVSASRHVCGGPSSVTAQRDYLDLEHPCKEVWGGRAFWQRAMRPGPDVGPGDVVVVSGNPRFLSTLRLVYLAHRRGMGVVWWGHGWSPTSSETRARVRTRLMRTSHAVLLYTDREVEDWRPRLPAHIGLFGAQNAVDHSQARDETARWNGERLKGFVKEQRLGERCLLLFCGRLRRQPATQLDVLLSALAKLIVRDPRYLLAVIGDGEEMPRLRAIAQARGVDAHVRWLGAQHDEGQLAPWFLSSLCFVYPGSIGLSLLHAMSYGLPVITHADRRHHGPEIAALRDGWNGIEFSPGDVDDLAQKVESLARNPELRHSMASNARHTAHSEFTIENMTERFYAAVSYARRHSMSRLKP
jgi:glycosyltransferase involved in cell wall biosynthesis